MTHSCHDRTCVATDCQTCNPSTVIFPVCPACGKCVTPSRVDTCQVCGNGYCVDCLDGRFVCAECGKESEDK